MTAYERRITKISAFIKKKLPLGFQPQFALTLGSGGLGDIANSFKLVTDPIPYSQIPRFITTSVEGHKGNFLAGYIAEVPVIGFQGRKHFYELGGQPDLVNSLQEITLPVQVAHQLGARIYFATNAAGALNLRYKPGDIMIISSHFGLFFPNPLQGPVVFNAKRFIPQNNAYGQRLRLLLHKASSKIKMHQHVHEGVYAAVPGPTYEARAESQALRKLGIDAVGMSTVPEIIVATSLGMETIGLSLITNVIASDGTNATSHEEVMRTLSNPKTRKRINRLLETFFHLYSPPLPK
ncbi:purine-nucleoside phosphorylase [Candidatus Roizmanbacteria bacterium]|nr:purine-nucleoside phosphorylase [Candidatus Roizmanbacteria bacterium]